MLVSDTAGTEQLLLLLGAVSQGLISKPAFCRSVALLFGLAPHV
jgi:hypothetical protein